MIKINGWWVNGYKPEALGGHLPSSLECWLNLQYWLSTHGIGNDNQE